jgi:hypothetical protein
MQMVSNLVAAGAATVVLVDGENISHALAGQIMAKMQPFGRAIVSRVYGDVARLPLWEAAAGFEMIHPGHAKNGADMRICIDALDLAGQGGIARVVIASSDRDFTHLAQYLRAKGIEVVGMGEGKTHESFRKACSHFVELGATKVETGVVHSTAAQDLTFQRVVAFVKAKGKDGIAVQKFNHAMARAFTFQVKQSGFSTWKAYFAHHSEQFDLLVKDAKTFARLK